LPETTGNRHNRFDSTPRLLDGHPKAHRPCSKNPKILRVYSASHGIARYHRFLKSELVLHSMPSRDKQKAERKPMVAKDDFRRHRRLGIWTRRFPTIIR